MEIPTVKIELYRSNNKQFAEYLGHLLETIGVAQISGMDDGLVDELYKEAKKFPRRVGRAKENSYYQEIFSFTPYSKIWDSIYISPEKRPVNLLRRIKNRFSQVAEKITDSFDSLYGPVEKPGELLLLRYRKGPQLYPPKKNRKKIMLERHTDESYFTLAAKASREGLEGYVQERWVPLLPEEGNFLIIPCRSLETVSKGKVKALEHRIRTPEPESPIRYALMYY